MYKYWEPVLLEEHRLFAREVAEMWGIYSTNTQKDNYHTKMVSTILSEEEYFARKNPLYYETKNGLVRTYSQDTINRAYYRLLTFSQQETKYLLYDNNGHKFKYRFKETTPAPVEA